MSYQRVIPRDLFNEAKLLKCLGQLALHIHEGRDGSGYRIPRSLVMEYSPEHDMEGNEVGFSIHQNPDCGSIYSNTVYLLYNGMDVELSSPLNSRETYPLCFSCEEVNCVGRVFDESGNFSDDFVNFLIYNYQENGE